MKQYARIFTYLSAFKGKIVLYFLFILLSILFSIVSMGMLMPFLQLIFTGKGMVSETNNFLIRYMNQQLNYSLDHFGTVKTLGIICVLMMTSILFSTSPISSSTR